MILELAVTLASVWPMPGPQMSAQVCRRNAPVEVLYDGRWWPATVNADGPVGGRCPIHYLGYGSSWDEAAPAERIRPAPPAAGKSGQPSPVYESTVACVGLLQRIGATISDQAARTEATAKAASLASGAFRLGRRDGKTDGAIQSDIDAALFAGEVLIPTTDQREATAALERVAPAAQECVALERMLLASPT